MASRSKRETVLPRTLQQNGSLAETTTTAYDQINENHDGVQCSNDQTPSILSSEKQTQRILPYPLGKSTESGQLRQFGVPVKPSATTHTNSIDPSGSFHYHRSYHIDQAGPGVIALQDVETLPACLIKERPKQGVKASSPIIHKNLICLKEMFEYQGKTQIVYKYEHLAISLSCVAGAVEFSEADIATICKELLEGLLYLHSAQKIAHGALDCNNILLTSKGNIKIANIGDSILRRHPPGAFQQDTRSLGSLVISLRDRANLLCETIQDMVTPTMSETARHFINKAEIDSASELLNHEFLSLANPGGAWSLKRHYFETLPIGIRIGSHTAVSKSN